MSDFAGKAMIVFHSCVRGDSQGTRGPDCRAGASQGLLTEQGRRQAPAVRAPGQPVPAEASCPPLSQVHAPTLDLPGRFPARLSQGRTAADCPTLSPRTGREQAAWGQAPRGRCESRGVRVSWVHAHSGFSVPCLLVSRARDWLWGRRGRPGLRAPDSPLGRYQGSRCELERPVEA